MWIVILIGFLFSTGIEVTQLLTYRGLFELDDIFYNTLGTAIGVAALYAVSEVILLRYRACGISCKVL